MLVEGGKQKERSVGREKGKAGKQCELEGKERKWGERDKEEEVREMHMYGVKTKRE